jgi:O-antigen ligase
MWLVAVILAGYLAPARGIGFVLGGFLALGLMAVGVVEPRWLLIIYVFWLGVGYDASRAWAEAGLPLGSPGRAIGLLLLVAWPLYRMRIARQRPLLDFRWSLLWFAPLFFSALLADQLNNDPSAIVGVTLATVLLGPVTYILLVDLIDTTVWFRRALYALAAQQVLQAGLSLYVLQGGAVPDLLLGTGFTDLRAAGLALDPNLYAIHMLALASLGLALLARGLSVRARVTGVTLAVLATIAIILSLSRGGLVALGAMVLFGGLFRRKDLPLYIALLILTSVAVFGATTLVEQWLSDALAARQIALYFEGERQGLWQIYLAVLSNQPFGLGLNAGMHPEIVRRVLAQYGVLGLAPHNLILDVWADLGLQGLVAFLGLVVVTIRSWLSCRYLTQVIPGRLDMEHAFNTLCLVGIGSGFIFTQGYYLKLVWVALALPLCLEKIARREAAVETSRATPIPITLAGQISGLPPANAGAP